MSDLVSITKFGEPKLKVHKSTLDEHVKLGWQPVEDEPEPAPVAAKPVAPAATHVPSKTL